MLALLCVAQFVIVLDVTIVAIALPSMQADLGLSTATLGWVVTVYTLVFGGCLLAAGRLGDRVGRRRAFAAGLVLFGAASLVCGLAPNGPALLAPRALREWRDRSRPRLDVAGSVLATAGLGSLVLGLSLAESRGTPA